MQQETLVKLLNMQQTNNIAVLLTCHNRKETTKTCLTRLFKIKSDIDVFCVDDNSIDGTSQMIESEFPQVILIKGNGNLFWCRGMRLAWEIARKQNDYEFYFWLNDDLELYDNAFNELLECSRLEKDQSIITGLVEEKKSHTVIYGGSDNSKKLIPANGQLNEVIFLNGNFVIIPRFVFNKIGFFDKRFHHDLGDVDYGLTAREKNLYVRTSRCYIGCTDVNLRSKHLRIRMDNVGIIKRFKRLYSPLGSNPFITFYFKQKHQGYIHAIVYFLYIHFINLLPDIVWNKISQLRY